MPRALTPQIQFGERGNRPRPRYPDPDEPFQTDTISADEDSREEGELVGEECPDSTEDTPNSLCPEEYFDKFVDKVFQELHLSPSNSQEP